MTFRALKRALLIGIDEYDNFSPLSGCVSDVGALIPLLARNEDGLPNFDCQALTSGSGRVDRRNVLKKVGELLAPGADVALLYFAGHGRAVPSDVVAVTQDGDGREAGVALSEVLGKVQSSAIGEVIVVLDCCFAGAAGGVPQLGADNAVIRSGVSVLSAAREDQSAAETAAGRGLFTEYLCGGLEGGAADILGRVTIAGLYAYLSESFGPWNQRPTYCTFTDRLNELRRCAPAVPFEDLRRLPEIFDAPGRDLRLDPSYEPDAELRKPDREAIFAILQRFRAAKLVQPVGAEHLYFAAMYSKSCRLTPLGKHYWKLAKQGRI